MALSYILRITVVSALLFSSVSGLCLTPRVRKEWRSLCREERVAWINAVKCLADLKHSPTIAATVDPSISLIPPLTTQSSRFDDFCYVHMDLNARIHNTGFFLPWHRWYLQVFEDALRSECNYDGVQPYWNWTLDAASFLNATIFDGSDGDGLGTWGDPNNDFQIFDGGFKDIQLAYPVPHKIRRNYTNYLLGVEPSPTEPPLPPPSYMMNRTFTKESVDAIVNGFTGDYVNFQVALEDFYGPHPGVHVILGGDLGGTCPFGLGPPECYVGMTWSPNDPLFYLHHSTVDKVWYEWQRRDPKNKNLFAGGSTSWLVNSTQLFAEYPTGSPPWLSPNSVMPSDGLWEGDVTVDDVLDTTDGKLCYRYE